MHKVRQCVDTYESIKPEAKETLLSSISSKVNYEENCLKDLSIPSFMICQLSLEVMKDPVITPSGITYDREMIEMHLSKNGEFDPVTREACPIKAIYPNTLLKQIIEEFIKKNPWAYEFEENENAEHIEF